MTQADRHERILDAIRAIPEGFVSTDRVDLGVARFPAGEA